MLRRVGGDREMVEVLTPAPHHDEEAAPAVFVDVIKEPPAILIMRPFSFDALAVQAHRLASDERPTQA